MGGNEQRDQRLFSYGTLRQENVQLTLFGRRLEGEQDFVAGYALSTVTIEDPEIIGQSKLGNLIRSWLPRAIPPSRWPEPFSC